MEKRLLNNLSILIKPSSSFCNLRCSYCFYADVSQLREVENYGFISKETTHTLIMRAFEATSDLAKISFAFQGGEPTLIGLDYFKDFVNNVNLNKGKRTIQYAIQTYGTIINESWAQFFKENDFLVGISIDGFQANHDQFRYDALKKGQFNNILDAYRLLKEYDVELNVLTVLTTQLSKLPNQLYDFYKEIDVDYIQLIPCLPELNNSEKDDPSLQPKEFYEFYKVFYNRWKNDAKRFQVHLINEILNMFQGYPPITCGMLGNCSLQFVVEGNGEVFPCDFYVLDKYSIGNINENTVHELISSKNVSMFLNEPKRVSSLCFDCEFRRMCNANCKRMNIVYFDETKCGYQKLLDFMR